MDIKIIKKNESTLYIEATNRIYGELSNYFSAYVDNYKWMPKFKSGQWNGKVMAFDTRSYTLPIGLLYKLHEFCAKGNYGYEQNFTIGQIVSTKELQDFVSSLNIPFEVRDYQFQAAYDAITKQHLNISSSTSSGKSLLMYIIVRWLMEQGKRILIVVPSTQLVEQLFSDFYSYGWNNVEDKVCMIYSGKERLVHRPVQISTWQSVYTEKDIDLIQSYHAVIIDECHNVSNSAKSLNMIAKNAVNACYRIGLSGSFPAENTADWLTAVGATGQIVVYSTYKTLQEQGHIADFTIVPLILSYPTELRIKAYEIGTKEPLSETEKYNVESDFVYGLECRNNFISKLCSNLKGNTLVLFKKKELHGIPLFNKLKSELKERTVLYIDGDIPVSEREIIRQTMEKKDDVVLVASLGTLSTGISIKNLHQLVFAAGTKSRVKTIQSIGRVLRLNHNKDSVRIFDIVDDLRIKDRVKKIFFKNYSYKHYEERMKIYRDNNFTIEEKQYTLK